MFKSLFGIAADIARVVTAPVEIALDVTRSVTKPIAELTDQTVNGIKEITTGGDKQ